MGIGIGKSITEAKGCQASHRRVAVVSMLLFIYKFNNIITTEEEDKKRNHAVLGTFFLSSFHVACNIISLLFSFT
jgi:hypothetical protein